MPPPSFSHPPAVVLPRSVQSWLKDISQKIRSALLSTEAAKCHAIVSAIETAVEDQARSLHTSYHADDAQHPAAAGPSPSAQIRTQISLRLNDTLLNLFQGEFESVQHDKLPVVVDILYALLPLLGTNTIVMEWWDLVLRPLLKNAAVQNVTANRARQLVVKAMAAAPSTAYEDEPPPTALWPINTTGSHGPAASSSVPTPRRPRDTPYPLAAATPISSSPSRQSPRSASMTSSSAQGGSRSASVGSRQDTFRRFTQRILDLYLAEAAQENEQHRLEDEVQLQAGRRASLGGTSQSGAPGRGDEANNNNGGSSSAGVAAGVQLRGAGVKESSSLVWKGNLESILLVYSNEKPKEFFHHLSESFSDAQSRVPLLFLLSTFLRLYPIHAYHITATALPTKLILSLQLDTSTTCVSLGVTALIMLIPHIPNWIANGGAGGLPTLLSIFARIVDWRRLGHGWEARVGDDPELEELRRQKDEEFAEMDRLGKRLNAKPSLRWHRLESSFDTAMSTPPNAEHLFTFLYGLFPCNLIRFLRSPVDYLKKASFDSPFEGPWEEMMDEMAIQSRSSPILRRHTLHPALITMDAETELTDKQRWLEHDSADINAECLGLFLGKWHDVNSTHIEQADRQRRGSMGHDQDHDHDNDHDNDLPDDESISVLSDPRHATFDLSRRRSVAPTQHPLSPISSTNHRYQRVPDQVNPDEILLTYASLRSGAPLAVPSTSSSMSSSMAQLTPLHRGDEAVSGGSAAPASSAPAPAPAASTSASRPSALATSGTLPRLLPAVTATAAATPATALATSSSASSSTMGPAITTSMPSSPATHLSQARARARSRSGSLSSVLSGMSPTTSTTPLSPTSTTQRHPLSSSHLPNDQTTPHQEKSAFLPPPSASSIAASSELSFLQRENLLIRNELNFELYLKEQHLRHIGRLHRDKVTDTALEAERQNLYHTVRSLRSQIAGLTLNLERQRAEAASTKARHVQWEAELNNKLKAYREERKAWTHEARQLKAQAEENAATISSLTKQLEETGARLFELQTKLEDDEPKLAKIEQYEAKIAQLTTCLTHWDDDVIKYDQQRQEMEKLLNRWDEMVYLVESTEAAMHDVEKQCRQVQLENERLMREMESAAKRMDALTREKNQLVLETLPSAQVVQSLADVEKERDQLREFNERLSATILDLKVRLEETLQTQSQDRSQAQAREQETIEDKDSHSTVVGPHGRSGLGTQSTGPETEAETESHAHADADVPPVSLDADPAPDKSD
ncbi:hypothetical protein BCV70DRAFT_56611 [Testicularia cyperi]|uniref:Hamartin-domain-containing protein n=1 Tax=Testicularia cyperi TaxID=1882483 RepID=A0A317XVY4_9BASI|nr:hypothetical protein BCV70DRAFT_56611 [Testicularia cyperi]